MRPEMELFEKMLKAHDWTYMYSDDNRAYVKGRDESLTIRHMLSQLEELGLKEESKELYNKYSPF